MTLNKIITKYWWLGLLCILFKKKEETTSTKNVKRTTSKVDHVDVNIGEIVDDNVLIKTPIREPYDTVDNVHAFGDYQDAFDYNNDIHVIGDYPEPIEPINPKLVKGSAFEGYNGITGGLKPIK